MKKAIITGLFVLLSASACAQEPEIYKPNIGSDGKYGIPTVEGDVSDWRATNTRDLDCEDIGREVSVGEYDPHGLDADHDGIGCEGW